MTEKEINLPPLANYLPKLKTDYISIYHNQTDGWLYVRWEGERTKENLISGANDILHFIKETGSRKLINDSRQSPNPLPEAVEWVSNVLAPQLTEVGLEYIAWIYGEKNKFAPTADAIISMTISDILVLVFDELELAEHWLRSIR